MKRQTDKKKNSITLNSRRVPPHNKSQLVIFILYFINTYKLRRENIFDEMFAVIANMFAVKQVIQLSKNTFITD